MKALEKMSQRNMLIMIRGEVRHLEEKKKENKISDEESKKLIESRLYMWILESMIQTSTDEEKE